MTLRESRDLFRERPGRAAPIAAEEPARPQVDRHRHIAAGHIGEETAVAAVHAAAGDGAALAGRVVVWDPSGDEHALSHARDGVDVHVFRCGRRRCRRSRQEIEAAGLHAGLVAQHNSPRGRSLMIGFMAEPDLDDAATLMPGLLRIRDADHTRSPDHDLRARAVKVQPCGQLSPGNWPRIPSLRQRPLGERCGPRGRAPRRNCETAVSTSPSSRSAPIIPLLTMVVMPCTVA